MKIRHQKLDRVTITGSRPEIQKAYTYCEKHDYRITRAGPLRISVRNVDLPRFKIIAEKPLK